MYPSASGDGVSKNCLWATAKQRKKEKDVRRNRDLAPTQPRMLFLPETRNSMAYFSLAPIYAVFDVSTLSSNRSARVLLLFVSLIKWCLNIVPSADNGNANTYCPKFSPSALRPSLAHSNYIHDLSHVILHFVFSMPLIVVQSFVAPALFCCQLKAVALPTHALDEFQYFVCKLRLDATRRIRFD